MSGVCVWRMACISSQSSQEAPTQDVDAGCRSEAEKIDSIANVQPRGSQRRIGPSAAKKLINLLTTLDPDAPFVD